MKFEITNNVLAEVLKLSKQIGADVEVFEGSNLDNYIISNTQGIEIHGKSAKYIIIKEVWQNAYSSKLELILTNLESKVKFYRSMFN